MGFDIPASAAEPSSPPFFARSDAIDNLLGSLIIAGHYAIPEVCVFFDNKLLRGNRSIKASSEEFHAFQSPNLPPLAAVGIDIGTIHVLTGLSPFADDNCLQTSSGARFCDPVFELSARTRSYRRKLVSSRTSHHSIVTCADSSSPSATLRIFPGISGSAIRAFLNADDVRGVVLESYGAGNAPRREELLSAFREATERGVVSHFLAADRLGAIAHLSSLTGHRQRQSMHNWFVLFRFSEFLLLLIIRTGAVAPDIYETGRALAA